MVCLPGLADRHPPCTTGMVVAIGHRDEGYKRRGRDAVIAWIGCRGLSLLVQVSFRDVERLLLSTLVTAEALVCAPIRNTAHCHNGHGWERGRPRAAGV